MTTPLTSSDASFPYTSFPWARAGLVLALAILVVRITGLFLTPINLGGDEAQYWLWAQDLDFGYASKPPLIAWSIWLSTTLAGSDAEAWVRLPSSLYHTGTALTLMMIGRKLYGPQAGFWALVIFLLMPGVQLSSGLISTDAPLLFFWSLALWAYLHMREGGSWSYGLALGGALGLAMLAKYAAVYFVLGVALDLARNQHARRNVLSAAGAVAVLAFVLVISPNIWWNLQNGLATISHTADNANWGTGQMFRLPQALEFFGAQFVVFGPLVFGALLAILWRSKDETTQVLKGFVWPIILIVVIQAFLSRAHANWAGVAYAAASVLVAGVMVRHHKKWLLWGTVALQVSLGAVFYTAGLSPAFADATGIGKSFKRVRAWPETTQAIDQIVKVYGPFDVLAVDNRLMFNTLAYYGRDLDLPPLRMWLYDGAHNHAERTAPLEENPDLRVLLISTRDDYRLRQAADFETFTPLETVSIPLAPGKVRTFTAFAATGHHRQDR